MLIVVVTVAVTAAAVLQTLRQEKLYQSSVNVFLDPRAVNSSIGAVQGSSNPDRVLDTQAQAAQIPAIADRALRIAGQSHRNPNAFLASAAVFAAPNADILTFVVKDSNPELAKKLTIAYAQSYRQYRREQETAALRRARKSVQKELAKAREKARDGKSGEVSLSSIERLEETDRQLANRAQEVALGTTVALGRLPSGAVQIQPHPRRNAILGAILGLLLGLGIVFLRDTLNTRVRTAGDVEERLGMPLLGRLDPPPKQLRSRDRLVMLDTPTAPGSEAFRLLATNLEFSNLDRGARSLMITSANRAEGKSTTVANLAVALARSGRRVVLMDLDLRRPVIAKFFDLEHAIGVTEVALGRATLDEALVKIPLGAHVVPSTAETNGHSKAAHPAPIWSDESHRAVGQLVTTHRGQEGHGQGSLEVLVSGPVPPNPAEFMRSHAMSQVLIEAGKRADVVLVDAPPILQVSDAAILTPKVDGVIVVTLMQVVRRGTLDELRRVLEKAPVTKIGFVVTGANAEEGFAGRDGYGYGMGYGADEEKKKRRSILSR